MLTTQRFRAAEFPEIGTAAFRLASFIVYTMSPGQTMLSFLSQPPPHHHHGERTNELDCETRCESDRCEDDRESPPGFSSLRIVYNGRTAGWLRLLWL